ncbi:carbonic anhydrase [Sphingorhabdus lacus]|jgi:carbonic anhydrase|uniref:carbonic anhydrase n=1 Tax=Sphingorhabdus lacus TaxID=392610 RepID=A0A6I6L286_9SPHN|nr:carbonic anhydrase [Sphingorhabdus lacus]QGY79800.1 carbonic anhydrase [Sphingorhabdus lacus]HPV69193.1 carbonic anhydrase [Sphingorhabdus lacus]
MPEFASLIEGYKRFRNDAYVKQKARFDALASDGQSPPVMIISCCDSRVDPATVFDTVPGQVFALRNVANLVPPYEIGGGLHGVSAAIEFGVLGLEVRHIVILGHAQCGGITASLSGSDLGQQGHSFVDKWVGIIDEARQAVLASNTDDPQHALELETVKVSLANLRTFPFIVEREKAGLLKLHGAYFGIAEGELHVLDETTGVFTPQ